MKYSKLLRITEIVWLIFAILCFLRLMMNWNEVGETKSWIYAGLGAVGVLMFFFRRYVRKRLEREEKQKTSPQE